MSQVNIKGTILGIINKFSNQYDEKCQEFDLSISSHFNWLEEISKEAVKSFESYPLFNVKEFFPLLCSNAIYGLPQTPSARKQREIQRNRNAVDATPSGNASSSLFATPFSVLTKLRNANSQHEDVPATPLHRRRSDRLKKKVTFSHH